MIPGTFPIDPQELAAVVPDCYVRAAEPGHIRHDLSPCFELHQNLLRDGAMLPDLTPGRAAA
jgi:hypothetical protein